MKRLGAGSNRIARLIMLVLLLCVPTGCANSGRNVLTDNLAEPLNGATVARWSSAG